jgi:hypothetical protein
MLLQIYIPKPTELSTAQKKLMEEVCLLVYCYTSILSQLTIPCAIELFRAHQPQSLNTANANVCYSEGKSLMPT